MKKIAFYELIREEIIKENNVQISQFFMHTLFQANLELNLIK